MRVWLLMAGFLAVLAQAASAAEVGRTAREEVIALGDAWVRAEIAQDRVALQQIFDPAFLSTFASGRTVDRATYIDYIMGAKIEPFRVVHEVVRVHADTALVIDLSESGGTKFTWIAVKRGGHWRVISQTFSKVMPP